VWRGEDGEASAALTRARYAAWWPGSNGKSAVGEELGGGDVQPRRGVEEKGDQCGESRVRASAFYRGRREAGALAASIADNEGVGYPQ
jgi:hypothetical protein